MIPLLEDYDRMRAAAAAGRHYRTYVEVDLSEAINHDLEGWLDILSDKATGSLLLMDIQWQVVDFKGAGTDTLILEVSGDVSEVLADLEETRWQ